MATNDLGRVVPLYKGTYATDAQYEKNDLVNYLGSLYWHTGTEPTIGTLPTNLAAWTLAMEPVAAPELPTTTGLLKGDGAGGAAAAVPGTDYLTRTSFELIEEITLSEDTETVERMNDTDNVPYNFTDFYVSVVFPLITGTHDIGTMTLRVNDDRLFGLAYYPSNSIGSNYSKHHECHYWIRNIGNVAFMSCYRGAYDALRQVGEQYPQLYDSPFRFKANFKVEKFKITAANGLPNGTQIKIYGIRA